jgi:hypothetical protein
MLDVGMEIGVSGDEARGARATAPLVDGALDGVRVHGVRSINELLAALGIAGLDT